MAKVLEFQLQHQSFQWTPRTDLLQNGLLGSPCSPRDSQKSSPTPQFKSINSSVLSLPQNCLEYSKWPIISQFLFRIGYCKNVSKWIKEKTLYASYSDVDHLWKERKLELAFKNQTSNILLAAGGWLSFPLKPVQLHTKYTPLYTATWPVFNLFETVIKFWDIKYNLPF